MASSEMSSFGPRGHRASQLELSHLDLSETARPEVRLRVEPDRAKDLRGLGIRVMLPRVGRVLQRDVQISRTVMLVNGFGI
jgi:hypothetical protein